MLWYTIAKILKKRVAERRVACVACGADSRREKALVLGLPGE